jgi:hypothetical protein
MMVIFLDQVTRVIKRAWCRRAVQASDSYKGRKLLDCDEI